MSVITLFLLAVGLIILVFGAELLVRGASALAVSVGISPLVVGLTVVAFGTSSPELAVSVLAAWKGQAGIALGNVVGSNICNVLLILGLSAVVAPLVVARQVVRLEVPIMIGTSLLLILFALDGAIVHWEGALLFAGVIGYTFWTIRRSRRELREQAEPAAAETPQVSSRSRQLVEIVGGLILLGIGSKLLVDGAVTIAHYLGVSDLIIGLTIIAVGTSLPELATSVLASWRGQRDIAVGNVVGSNIFNILAVLGLSTLVAPGELSVPPAALTFDLPIMLAVAVACLPIFMAGHRINRWEGLLFLGYYGVYVLFLVLTAIDHDSRMLLGQAMLWFVLPLTGLTLAISLWRHRPASRF
jgi:cation:H+ antiporter